MMVREKNTYPSSNAPSLESRPAVWDFRRLFHPRTVAVIGVSLERDRHPANVIFNKIQLRYPVDVFPVNPRGGDLFGQKVYTDIQAIPHTIDLAIIIVRAQYTLDTLRACIDAGAGGATIISGGFAEVVRLDLQQQLAELARTLICFSEFFMAAAEMDESNFVKDEFKNLRSHFGTSSWGGTRQPPMTLTK